MNEVIKTFEVAEKKRWFKALVSSLFLDFQIHDNLIFWKLISVKAGDLRGKARWLLDNAT